MLLNHRRREWPNQTSAALGLPQRESLVFTHAKTARHSAPASEQQTDASAYHRTPIRDKAEGVDRSVGATKGVLLPAEELDRVTNHVMSQIDRRLNAYRERTGRI